MPMLINKYIYNVLYEIIKQFNYSFTKSNRSMLIFLDLKKGFVLLIKAVSSQHWNLLVLQVGLLLLLGLRTTLVKESKVCISVV